MIIETKQVRGVIKINNRTLAQQVEKPKQSSERSHNKEDRKYQEYIHKTQGSTEVYVSGTLGRKYMKIDASVSPIEISEKIKEMARSVTHGYKEKISIKGVGYRAQVVEDRLELSLGYKQPIVIKIPSNITLKIKGGGMIIEG
ncbi:MAG: 50S ribosomal protein L6 [Proteobacteria bacterium]|nr:50S ribosomal protein L6 [Pseudomonadota bacterium]